MSKTELNATEGGEININGHFGGKSVEEKTTHQADDSWRYRAEQLNTDIKLLRQECEVDKKALRKELEDIRDKQVKDMRKLVLTGIAVGIVVIAMLGWALFQPAVQDDATYRVDALNPTQMYELSLKGNPAPPEYQLPVIPISGEHCILEAVTIDNLSGVNEPECYSTLDDALGALSKRTGQNKENLLLALKNEDHLAAVIGVWYSLSGYTGSSTVIYAGNDGGCYGGQEWYVPVINQTIRSALKLGGCGQNTLYSDYYFNGALQWCNCSSVWLSRVRSADYK